jgi:site-specific recombinase XerD
MLAYGGFRPSEDRNAEWGDLRNDALRVYATKTRRERYVDLLAPLAHDLAEWRLACGGTADGLIVPRPSGGPWRREDWANWRRRVYRPAAVAAGVTGDLRPYRLRGSFVSLLLWAGEDLVYVAEQAGHSVATLARHYAGVIRELRDVPKAPAAELIWAARNEVTAARETRRGRTR